MAKRTRGIGVNAYRRSSVRPLRLISVDLRTTNSTLRKRACSRMTVVLLQTNSRSLSSSLTMLMVSTALERSRVSWRYCRSAAVMDEMSEDLHKRRRLARNDPRHESRER